jgi:hypothetical protein
MNHVYKFADPNSIVSLVCKYCGGSNMHFLRPVSDFKSAQVTAVCMDCGAEF